jgi:hypothetical protein
MGRHFLHQEDLRVGEADPKLVLEGCIPTREGSSASESIRIREVHDDCISAASGSEGVVVGRCCLRKANADHRLWKAHPAPQALLGAGVDTPPCKDRKGETAG